MNTAVHVQQSVQDEVNGQVITTVQSKILYVLGLYPKLSRSMLQTGIGPAISPVIWGPVLDDMIGRRLVQEVTVNVKGASGRANSPKILSLTEAGLMLVPEDIKGIEDPNAAANSHGSVHVVASAVPAI